MRIRPVIRWGRRPFMRPRPFIMRPGFRWRRPHFFLGGCGFIAFMMFACFFLLMMTRILR